MVVELSRCNEIRDARKSASVKGKKSIVKTSQLSGVNELAKQKIMGIGNENTSPIPASSIINFCDCEKLLGKILSGNGNNDDLEFVCNAIGTSYIFFGSCIRLFKHNEFLMHLCLILANFQGEAKLVYLISVFSIVLLVIGFVESSATSTTVLGLLIRCKSKEGFERAILSRNWSMQVLLSIYNILFEISMFLSILCLGSPVALVGSVVKWAATHCCSERLQQSCCCWQCSFYGGPNVVVPGREGLTSVGLAQFVEDVNDNREAYCFITVLENVDREEFVASMEDDELLSAFRRRAISLDDWKRIMSRFAPSRNYCVVRRASISEIVSCGGCGGGRARGDHQSNNDITTNNAY